MLRSKGPKKIQNQHQEDDALNFVMIDIGSGNGNRAAQWISRNRTVHVFCFDPLDSHFISASQLASREKRLHVYKAAVSQHTGELPFYFANDTSSGSLLPFGTPESIKKWKYPPGKIHFKTIKTSPVQTIRMDKFLIDRRISRVMFVRIETQGTALDVVKSFGSHIKNVMEFAVKIHLTDFDIYSGQTHKDELVEYMNESGFSIFDSRIQSQNQEEVIWFVNRHYMKQGLTHNDLI